MEEWSKNMRALFDREWLYIYVGIIKYVNIGREKKLSGYSERGEKVTGLQTGNKWTTKAFTNHLVW